MKKALLALALASASVLSTGVAHAGNHHGFYAGANLGHSALNADLDRDNGASGGAYVGYQYNKHLAVETGLTRFATIRDQGAEAKLDALTVQGVARHSVPHFRAATVFAKAGVGYTYAHGGGESSHKFSPVAAVGVDYALNKKVSLRAEHQYLHDFADSGVAVRNTVVGLNYKF